MGLGPSGASGSTGSWRGRDLPPVDVARHRWRTAFQPESRVESDTLTAPRRKRAERLPDRALDRPQWRDLAQEGPEVLRPRQACRADTRVQCPQAEPLLVEGHLGVEEGPRAAHAPRHQEVHIVQVPGLPPHEEGAGDRKNTPLKSNHRYISSS